MMQRMLRKTIAMPSQAKGDSGTGQEGEHGPPGITFVGDKSRSYPAVSARARCNETSVLRPGRQRTSRVLFCSVFISLTQICIRSMTKEVTFVPPCTSPMLRIGTCLAMP